MVPENCVHRFIFDNEKGEIVCVAGCGWVVPAFERREVAYPPSGRHLSSPSAERKGLGTDENRTIFELSHNAWAKDFEGKKTVRQLSGAVRFLPKGHGEDDEDLVMLLTDRLHGRVSNWDLAQIAHVFRLALMRLESEKRRKAEVLLNQVTGVGGVA